MDAPSARFASTSDGKAIAYGVSGDGPPLLLGPIPFSHVQLVWGVHNASAFIRALAGRFRVVHFDPRGLGMSPRGLGPGHRLDDWLLDIDAVVAAEKLERFMLLSSGFGGHVAARYAVQHPERVTALVMGGFPPHVDETRWLAPRASERDFDLFLSIMTDPTEPFEYREKQIENLRRIITVEDHNDIQRAVRECGGSEAILSRLTTPTLVIHSRGFRVMPEEDAARVAQLAHGRLQVIDGVNAYGDPDQALRALSSFLDELPRDHAVAQESDLSPRELEVLVLVATGRSNQQIADELVISRNTVQRHVSNIFDKVGAANRAEATAYALRRGLA
jgi:DNA-binding NarL/FixJ family response regulator